MRSRLFVLLALVLGCSPGSLVDVEPSGGIVPEETVKSAAGAQQLANLAIQTFHNRLGGSGQFSAPMNNMIVSTALFTDEIMRTELGGNIRISWIVGIDERAGSGFSAAQFGILYRSMHQPRVAARQAREALQKYVSGSDTTRGLLFAYEAYTVVYLAEMYCSGIPLTTVPLEAVPVMTPGFTTSEMFTRAVAMFDSAMTLASGNARITDLARVGKGRALLGLGRFADAAAAVTAVPTDFMALAEFDPTASTTSANGQPRGNEMGYFVGPPTAANYRAQAVDNEGTNGLVWSSDPRTGMRTDPSNFGAMWIPAKYSKNAAGALQVTTTIPTNPIRIADGLESRLIEAEAALQAGNASWLSTLNMLRATCIGAAACAPVPGLTAAQLPALADPGTAAARVDLLMRERAMWLYLTGHRQGDLRRLARYYNRLRETLWPWGTYSNPGFGAFVPVASTHGTNYGTDVVFLPDPNEQLANPLYAGCFNTDP